MIQKLLSMNFVLWLIVFLRHYSTKKGDEFDFFIIKTFQSMLFRNLSEIDYWMKGIRKGICLAVDLKWHLSFFLWVFFFVCFIFIFCFFLFVCLFVFVWGFFLGGGCSLARSEYLSIFSLRFIFTLVVFHRSLSDSKFSQLSWTLLSNLADIKMLLSGGSRFFL